MLACGDSAVLSHRSAAVAWALLAGLDGDVDVIVPERGRQRRPGIRVHRSRLQPVEVTRRHGMPVTTPLRTILDLAAVARPAELELAVAEAERRRLATTPNVRKAIEESPRRAGMAQLRSFLDRVGGPALTRSAAERELLRLVRAAGLPAPEHNVAAGGHVVDLMWREQRLVAEVDGYAYHSGRAAFERDRSRDAELLAAGYRVLRVTWRQLVERPEAVVARLAEGLVGSPA